jgi:hypothetical protein
VSAARAAVLVLLGCARMQATATRATPPAEPGAAARVADAPPWRSLLANSLPMPLRAMSAVSADTAAVISESGAFLLRGDAVTPICEEATDDGAALVDVAAERGSVWVLGLQDRGVLAWRASADGACVALPSPGRTLTANSIPRVRARGGHVWVWAPEGPLWRSDDAGARWTALPALPPSSRLRDVFAGPEGATWASVSSADTSDPRHPSLYRGRVARLDEGSPPRWITVADDRALPVALSARRDGRWALADGVEWLEIERSGAPRAAHPLAWSRGVSDAPAVLTDAGDGRFFGSAGRQLLLADDRGVRALGLLPGSQLALALDASPDGALWATNLHSLWQLDARGGWRDRTQRPWSAHGIIDARARGPFAAVATDGGQLLVREPDRARWVAQDLPASLGRAVALGINASGAVLALCERGAVLGDARGLAAVDAPVERGAMEETPSVHASGDRWVILRGGVWTSDDEGASWRPRLGAREGAAATRPITALAVVAGRAIALDEEFSLWRSDDAAATWRRASSSTPWPSAEPPRWNSARPLLAWDGRQRVALLARNLLAVSDDGGATWESRSVDALSAALALRDDGTVFIAARRTAGVGRACDSGQGVALMAGDLRGVALVRDGCEHLGDVISLNADEGTAFSVRRDGAAWIGSFATLPDPTAPRIY